MNILIFYIFTLLISTSLLYTWFKSSLPNLVFHFLKKLWFLKNNIIWKVSSDDSLGIELDPMYWTEKDWEIVNSHLGLLGHLISCKFCLCYHIVSWVNIISYLILIFFTNLIDFSFILVIAIALSQPILVHILINITDKLENND